MFEITMQNGELNDTYYGSINGAPGSIDDMPAFLKQNPFIVFTDSSGKKTILNTSNIISITGA